MSIIDRRRFIGTAAAAALLAPGLARAQTAALDDAAIIGEALTLHPGVHRYLSPRQFDAQQRAFAEHWAANSDLRHRYVALGRFLARLQCGHSYPNFYNQRDEIKQALFADLPRVPFAFRWVGAAGREAMVVTGDAGGTSGLPRGTVITRLNGRRPRDILRSLIPYARADGGNDGKRRSLLEMRGDDGLETFDIWHGLVFGGTAADAIRIEARLPDGRRAARELASATLASRIAGASSGPPSGDTPVWQWDERADGIALLTMNGWALYNSRWDWRGWLDERLASLPARARLVIDIRANEGGLDCGDHLLARLAPGDLISTAYERRVRFRRTPEALNPFMDTWDNSFRTLGEGAEPVGDGFFRLPAEEGRGIIAARGPRIAARVAVLTSAVNSSATFAFAQKCRESGLARLFGETTGGNRRGINGGAFFFVRLPESGIEFDLPLIGSFPTVPQPDAGIAPDVTVAATPADIAAGRDPVLEAAVSWLARG